MYHFKFAVVRVSKFLCEPNFASSVFKTRYFSISCWKYFPKTLYLALYLNKKNTYQMEWTDDFSTFTNQKSYNQVGNNCKSGCFNLSFTLLH